LSLPRALRCFPTRRSSDLGEAAHDVGHTGGSVDAQRARPAGRPGLQVELPELADVVGVEVREEDGPDGLATHAAEREGPPAPRPDRKSTRLNSSHQIISYA